MSTFAPDSNCNLTDIFDERIPKVDSRCTNEDDVNAKEKCIVSPELIAYLKWLIYTAAFKDPFAEQQGAIHRQFYLDWVDTFASKEDSFRQRLKEQLEIWYAKFPAGKKCGRSSCADNIPRANSGRSVPLDDPHVQDDEVAGPRPAVWRCCW